jgi:hypothetical protein
MCFNLKNLFLYNICYSIEFRTSDSLPELTVTLTLVTKYIIWTVNSNSQMKVEPKFVIIVNNRVGEQL